MTFLLALMFGIAAGYSYGFQKAADGCKLCTSKERKGVEK